MSSSEGADTLDRLVTESRRADNDYASLSTQELVELMNTEDASVPEAVGTATAAIAGALDAIVERLAGGGRLVYLGAGTSGRIAALDAEECEGTFSTRPGQVVALVAGADASSADARAAAEDDAHAGRSAVEELGVSSADAVVGISASGRTPYVLGGLEAAAEAGALTVALVSANGSPLAREADHELAVIVGPEVVSGSTRLKAGTAQKLVLNTISTVTMIRLGRTYGGLMVGVVPANEKLRERARRNVVIATGASEESVDEALNAAAGDARVALVSLLAGVDAQDARSRLEASEGSVRKAAGQ